nr:MAG TPA: hypothetical protein [Caudoviricetes sp.]
MYHDLRILVIVILDTILPLSRLKPTEWFFYRSFY